MSRTRKRLSDEVVARLLNATESAVPRETDAVQHWALLVLSGRRQGRVYPLPRAGSVRIGRGADNWICFDADDERSISQHHAEIAIDTESVVVEDLQSTNGTCVNDKKLTAAVKLREGDSLRLGQVPMALMLVSQHA